MTFYIIYATFVLLILASVICGIWWLAKRRDDTEAKRCSRGPSPDDLEARTRNQQIEANGGDIDKEGF